MQRLARPIDLSKEVIQRMTELGVDNEVLATVLPRVYVSAQMIAGVNSDTSIMKAVSELGFAVDEESKQVAHICSHCYNKFEFDKNGKCVKRACACGKNFHEHCYGTHECVASDDEGSDDNDNDNIDDLDVDIDEAHDDSRTSNHDDDIDNDSSMDVDADNVDTHDNTINTGEADDVDEASDNNIYYLDDSSDSNEQIGDNNSGDDIFKLNDEPDQESNSGIDTVDNDVNSDNNDSGNGVTSTNKTQQSTRGVNTNEIQQQQNSTSSCTTDASVVTYSRSKRVQSKTPRYNEQDDDSSNSDDSDDEYTTPAPKRRKASTRPKRQRRKQQTSSRRSRRAISYSDDGIDIDDTEKDPDYVDSGKISNTGNAKGTADKLARAKDCIMRRIQMDVQAAVSGDHSVGRCQGAGCNNELIPCCGSLRRYWRDYLLTLTKQQALAVLQAGAEAPKHNLPPARPNVQLHLIDISSEELPYKTTDAANRVLCKQCTNSKVIVGDVMNFGVAGNERFLPMKHQFDVVNSKYGDAVGYLDSLAREEVSSLLARLLPTDVESIEVQQQHDGNWVSVTEDMSLDDDDYDELSISDHEMSVLPDLFKLRTNSSIKLVVKHLEFAWYQLGGPRPLEDIQAQEAQRVRLSQKPSRVKSTVTTTTAHTADTTNTDTGTTSKHTEAGGSSSGSKAGSSSRVSAHKTSSASNTDQSTITLATKLGTVISAILSQQDDTTYVSVDDHFAAKANGLVHGSDGAVAWTEIRSQVVNRRGDINADKLMRLAASKAANFILSGGTDIPNEANLVYTIGNDRTAPCITSMAALRASTDSAHWLHYLAVNGERPATEDAVIKAIHNIWPDVDRRTTRLIKEDLSNSAKQELTALLSQDSEVHKQLDDQIDNDWSIHEVQQLRTEDIFENFTVELYQTDTSPDAVERGVLTYLALFVADDADDDIYCFNTVYHSVISEPPVEHSNKGKGKGEQKAKATSRSGAAAGSRT
jgi:hypothetical protein